MNAAIEPKPDPDRAPKGPGTLLTVATLILSHLFALNVGSNLQFRSQGKNSHAHLSDVGAAITLGEYFVDDQPTEVSHAEAARAVGGIIFRILHASNPGPNSTVRLESLEREIYTRFPAKTDPGTQPKPSSVASQ